MNKVPHHMWRGKAQAEFEELNWMIGVQWAPRVFQKQVSGGATVYLGQDRDFWTPLIHTTVNLSDIHRYVCRAKPLHNEGFTSNTPWSSAAKALANLKMNSGESVWKQAQGILMKWDWDCWSCPFYFRYLTHWKKRKEHFTVILLDLTLFLFCFPVSLVSSHPFS